MGRFFCHAIATATLLIAGSNLVLAQPATDCAAIEDANARLLCYDAALRSERVDVPTKSAWEVSKDTSRIDDSETVVLRTISTNEVRSRYGRSERATLIARCQENVTATYLIAAGHFLSDIDSLNEVTYRIDRTPAQTERMGVSNDNAAIGFWDGARSIPFLQSLFRAEALVVRLTPYNESPITMEFNIAGLEEVIEPLRSACGWEDHQASHTPSSGPAPTAPAELPSVIQVGGEGEFDACPSNGVVANLNPRGENFLSVRSGPGTEHDRLDQIENGQGVYICDEDNGWFAVVYGDGDCGVSSPIVERRTYTGPCRSGWVSAAFVETHAG